MARLNRVASFRGTTKTEDGNLTCSKCRTTITPGMPYQWWANKLPQSRGSVRRIRCMNCTPTRAEMTPGRRGQLMRMQDAAERAMAEAQTFDDIRAARDGFADELRDLASEYTEGADNMEEGFGHATSMSDELREKGETLEEVADTIGDTEPDNEPDEPADEPDYSAVDMDAEQADIDGARNDAEDAHIAEHQEYEDALEAFREAVNEAMQEAEV